MCERSVQRGSWLLFEVCFLLENITKWKKKKRILDCFIWTRAHKHMWLITLLFVISDVCFGSSRFLVSRKHSLSTFGLNVNSKNDSPTLTNTDALMLHWRDKTRTKTKKRYNLGQQIGRKLGSMVVKRGKKCQLEPEGEAFNLPVDFTFKYSPMITSFLLLYSGTIQGSYSVPFLPGEELQREIGVEMQLLRATVTHSWGMKWYNVRVN